MNIHLTTVPAHFTDINSFKPPKISATRYAHRVQFNPVGKKGPGLFAPVQVPLEGVIHSIAVHLNEQPPSGKLLLSAVDPTFYYNGFFLHTILDDIPVTATDPKMWRKTEIYGAAYSTIQANPGLLYLLILNGPTGSVLADIAITAETD